MTKPIVWTIAGSDSGGGAGIQADLHTLQDFDCHGCSVVTAITAQNSQKVASLEAVSTRLVEQQLVTLAEDLPAQVVKTGMLANAGIIKSLLQYLQKQEQAPLLVCDPVLSASAGAELLDQAGLQCLINELLPQVFVLTPNAKEAEILSGVAIDDAASTEVAAQALLQKGCQAVLIKGGHAGWQGALSCDYFSNGELGFWLTHPRYRHQNTHGSGCTLASALAACLAQNMDIEDAVVMAKAYVSQGIRLARQIGQGPGALAHEGWLNELQDFPRVYKNFADIGSLQEPFSPCDTDQLGLYPVVDSPQWVSDLLSWGVETLQLRVKDKTEAEVGLLIEQSVAAGKGHFPRLFINDYWQLAIKHGAYGVHLGQEDLDEADLSAIREAGLKLGVSTHSYFEIARALAVQPSYIAIGPIFPTTTKKMRWEQQGLEQLYDWVQLLDDQYPLVAIGGINYERAEAVLATGVGSLAMVSAITQAEKPEEEVKRLQGLFAEG